MMLTHTCIEIEHILVLC